MLLKWKDEVFILTVAQKHSLDLRIGVKLVAGKGG